MKAVVHRRYGPPDVLRYEDVDRPVPAEGEVLLAVRAASVNPLDWHFLRGIPYALRLATGLRAPKYGLLGVDVAGEVEAVGAKVARFKPGDAVFGSCRGAFAEFACAPESVLVAKPAAITFEQAASAPVAAYTALQAFRDKARLRPGQAVLINGASGGVGTFAVQIAKWMGAEVTGVCSTRNVELVRSIGADHVVDYTREDFTRGARRYDVILDAVGNHPLSAFRRALAPEGTYVGVGGGTVDEGRWIGPLADAAKPLVLSPFVRQRLRTFLARRNKDDLAVISGLMETGKVKPVIERRYTLPEVPDAIRHVEEGHARGKVVIRVERA